MRGAHAEVIPVADQPLPGWSSNDILLRLYAVWRNHNELAKRFKNDFIAIPEPYRNLLQQKCG